MHKEWKATSGGIMCLIMGAWGVMSGVILAFITSNYPTVWIRLSPMETLVVNRLAPFGIALGLVAILGGVYALRRRRWGLALAGAICAAMIPPPLFLGVLAIVFIAVGRDEFREGKAVSLTTREYSTDFVLPGIVEPSAPPERDETDGITESPDSAG